MKFAYDRSSVRPAKYAHVLHTLVEAQEFVEEGMPIYDAVYRAAFWQATEDHQAAAMDALDCFYLQGEEFFPNIHRWDMADGRAMSDRREAFKRAIAIAEKGLPTA